MSLLRLGVVAVAAAAAILGFKKINKRSRDVEALAPASDTAQDEPISEPSWPVGARS